MFQARAGQLNELDDTVELYKLDRLRELRAVIDNLRGDCEAQDPLLSWVIAREKAENHHRD